MGTNLIIFLRENRLITLMECTGCKTKGTRRTATKRVVAAGIIRETQNSLQKTRRVHASDARRDGCTPYALEREMRCALFHIYSDARAYRTHTREREGG